MATSKRREAIPIRSDPANTALPAAVDGHTGLPASFDYRRVFESAIDGILIADNEGRYLDANPAVCKLTGYSREEILSMRVGDMTVEEERASAQQHRRDVQESGSSTRVATVVTKSGTRLIMESRAVAIGDGMTMGILHDISARVAMEQELRGSLEAYETLVGICRVAVISADRSLRITSWNRGAEDIFGYTTDEIVGQSTEILCPDRYRKQYRSAFARHIGRDDESEPSGQTIEVEGLAKNGSEVSIEISLAVGRRAGEQVFSAIIRDVTEQRQMVERLNDALQRLQFHIDRMPLAYIVWNTDFIVVDWNPAAERIFGYTKEEAVGRHAYGFLVSDDTRPEVDEIWADLIKGDTSSHSINPNLRKDGSRLMCEWFNTPLLDSMGKITGVASMVMDVSEREATERQLRNAQKLESLGVMASGIAHDFNSALMVILGNASLLRSVKGIPRSALEHLDLIETAGSRANDMIRHLLAYARTGRHNPQPTNVNAVIRDGQALLRSSLGPGHELRLCLTPDLPIIRADRSQLEQILINLCLNAKQAMPDGGTIIVATRPTTLTPTQAARCLPGVATPGEYVELSVTDSGCGMSKSTIGRIFDPFFTTKPDGHGLGLAAVLGILRHHRALTYVDSSLKKGTSIRVYFPLPQERTTT